jgi:hypothetical protein
MPNVLSANALYGVPVGKGQRFSTGNNIADYLLGNWQINSIFTWRDGEDFTAVDSNDVANTGNSNDYERVNVVGNPNLSHRTTSEWFNVAAFAVPPKYTFGNAYRNSLREQRWINLDSSVIRSFPFLREERFEFRAEAFNLLNHPIFGEPTNDISSTTFGAIGTSQANLNRRWQMSGKIVF